MIGMGITGSSEIERVRRLLSEGREIVWYNSAAWERTRQTVQTEQTASHGGKVGLIPPHQKNVVPVRAL